MAQKKRKSAAELRADRQRAWAEETRDEVARALAGIAFAEVTEESATGLKYTNKLKALELLGKHLGMFVDRAEQDEDASVRVVMDDETRELAE